jgi:hypothetical protein
MQLSAVYQRCNSGHRDDDLLNFYAGTLAVEGGMGAQAHDPQVRNLQFSSARSDTPSRFHRDDIR